KHEDLASIHRLVFVIERLRHLLHDKSRHLRIDLAGQVDEPRLVVERAHLPGEVVRIERDAVSADSRARRELHETERLGGGSVDHFPDVDAQLLADDRHLIRETDVDRAEGVLQQLDELSGLRRADWYDRIEAALIQRCRDFGACWCNSADDLGCVFGMPDLIAGIHTLWT